MKKKMRVMAMILAAALCVSSVPFSVFAEEMETEVVAESTENVIDDMSAEDAEQVEELETEVEAEETDKELGDDSAFENEQLVDDIEIVEEKEEVVSKDSMMEEISSGTCGEKLTWKVEGNTLTISGEGDMNDYSEITDYSILSGPNIVHVNFRNPENLPPWDYYRLNNGMLTDVTSVVIEEGVTSIGCGAFAGWDYLEEVHLPDSLTYISKHAFAACIRLKRVIMTEEEEWDEIIVECGNDPLLSASIQYTLTESDEIPDAAAISFTATYYHPDEKSSANLTLSYDETDFAKPSTIYNHSLARFAIELSTMAYSTDAKMKKALKGLKYKNVTPKPDETGSTSPFWISHKKVMLEGEETELLNIVVRGTYHEEWVDNFDPGMGDTHKGFQRAAQFILDNTKKYINDTSSFNKSAKVKLFITGHSRGAAAANLLGAMLDENGDIGAASSLTKEDIFVYTFATPNPTSKKIAQENYNNIYNIVNPEDFVTKVLLSQWGYHRYGTTYVLPSATTEQGKKEPYVQYENMYLPQIRNFYNTVCYNAGGYEPYENGTTSLLNYVKFINSNVKNVDQFYKKDLLDNHIYEEGAPYSLQKLYQNALGKNQSKNEDYENQSTIVIVAAICNSYGYVGLKTINYFFYHQMLRSDFAKAHRAETYLAGMLALDEKQLTADRKIIEGIVNCPVDITVKDEDGKIVGRIVNNIVDDTIEDGITMSVDGDSKVLYMPAQNKYTVELTGNNNGIMDYSLADVSPDTGEESRVFYGDVPIVKGETLTQVILPKTELSYDTLVDNEGSEVLPTAVISNEELGGLKTEVTVEGPGAASGVDNATPGDYITLSALPEENGEFSGWYDDNDELLSQELEYSFSISEDKIFKAKFKEKEYAESDNSQSEVSLASQDVESYFHSWTIVTSEYIRLPLKKTKFLKVKAGKKKASLKWKKAKGIDGYQIQYSTNKKFKKKKTKTIEGDTIVQATIKKLKKGKKYYFRVRTYKDFNKKRYYSRWSKVKSLKIKK